MSLNASHLMKYLKDCKGFEKVLRNLRIITLGNGKCQAEMKIEQEHTNALGALHGGLSATLVDCVSTYALMSRDEGACANVSVNINMSYIKGATLGEEIVIDANTIKIGKTLAFLEVDIKNKATGDFIAKGSHTKFMLRK